MGGLLILTFASLMFLKVHSKFLRLSVSMLLFMGLGVAYYLGWEKLESRIIDSVHGIKGRAKLFDMASKMIDEYPIFGSGPNSFEAIAQFELGEKYTHWESWVHNDYMEFFLTFGMPGGSLLIALAIILTLQYLATFSEGTARSFKWFGFLAIVGVATHALQDFPLQVYSILTLLTLIAAIILPYRSPGRIIHRSDTNR